LWQKAQAAFSGHFGASKAARIMDLFADRATLEATPVQDFVDLFVAKAPGP
jgi:hypothetical protein